VDVAAPTDGQPSIVHRAIAAGMHVLAQKPLAVTYREAVQLVEAADNAGVVLAVNQNGRFDPSINAARGPILDGALGTRLVAAISRHIETIWQTYLRDPRYSRLMILTPCTTTMASGRPTSTMAPTGHPTSRSRIGSRAPTRHLKERSGFPHGRHFEPPASR
jgi:hypothetical protein